MSRGTVLKLLLLLNLALGGALVFRTLRAQPATALPKAELPGAEAASAVSGESPAVSNTTAGPSSNTNAGTTAGMTTNAPTVFSMIYSADPATFAANLRAIGCPEDTLKDILTAEVHRRFNAQEKALRPTPADHVPWMWSAQTTEPRLLERREQAAELARKEGTLLREALGCVPSVPMPLYAMTSSDQQFEDKLASSPQLDACSIREVHDTYWADVQKLLDRTKGFWLPEDVVELNLLKERHRQALSGFMPEQ